MGEIPIEVGWDDAIEDLWNRVVELYGHAVALQAMKRAIQSVPLQEHQAASGTLVEVRTGYSAAFKAELCDGFTQARTDGLEQGS
jgi:hypothetical protein